MTMPPPAAAPVPTDLAALRQRVAALLAENPGEMTPLLAHRLGVAEADVIRAFPPDQVTELDASRWEEIVRALADLGRVHVIASNDGVVLETHGTFGGFSRGGPFFNVQTRDLDMHIKWPELAAVFAVIKPSHMDGQRTYSVQFYGRRGQSCFKVFLYKSLDAAGGIEERVAAWERLRAAFAREG